MADIYMTRGDTVVVKIATTLAGEVYSLAGVQAMQFVAKTLLSDTDAFFLKQLGDGVVVTDAAGGLAQIVISPSDTSSLAGNPSTLYWDLRIKDSIDQIFTLNSGKIVVSAPVGALTSIAVRRSAVAADSANNLADAAANALSAGAGGADSMLAGLMDSLAWRTETKAAVEDGMAGFWRESAAAGRGSAVGEALSMSEAVAIGRGLAASDNAANLADAVAAFAGPAELLSDTNAANWSDGLALGHGAAASDSIALSDAEAHTLA